MGINQAAPTSEKPCWLVGRNSRGHWIACDRSSQHGGFFASLTAAQRYARLQTIGRDATIVMVKGQLELDLSLPHHVPPSVGKHNEQGQPQSQGS
jgi:hypothetical protein